MRQLVRNETERNRAAGSREAAGRLGEGPGWFLSAGAERFAQPLLTLLTHLGRNGGGGIKREAWLAVRRVGSTRHEGFLTVLWLRSKDVKKNEKKNQ